ncbi:RodZ domain-containing protein [Halomonadaceae bacterium KBTZ08]
MTEEGSAHNGETTPQPVGEQLRAARERHGMERQDVADQLHLRPSIIQAIEESDYEDMPVDLFLKGYVRSYARLTDQDGDDLVARLDSELEPYRQREEHKELSPTEIIHQRKVRRRRIGVALITTIMVLVLGWLVYQYGPWVFDSAGDVVDTTSEAGETSTATESSDELGAESTSEPDTASAEQAGTDGVAADQEATAGTATEAQPGLSGPIETVDTPATEAGVTESRSDTTPAPNNGEASLLITFDGACWVEVVDGNGERVVVTLAQKGDRVDYEGPEPFEVLLGNVDAVAGVRFRGDPVDLDQYPVSGGRTQFVLETANG